ncbi:hypothetical protein [Actinoplanes solisilvae]|uniref:hypothetical protein n=1 Tax=Actinoplanes solisilvae TaxID=2486853 RepID=UPI000FDA036B|nr:hypothetical protein [Actinoplanes solisilvae]
MTTRLLISLAWIVLMSPGAAMLGAAVIIGAGIAPAPRGRLWDGPVTALSRPVLGLYFFMLGLAFVAVVTLTKHLHDSPSYLAVVAAPAAVTAVLIVGWIVMARRVSRRDPAGPAPRKA